MRICHVLSSFDLGGQERVALDLARAQRANGHEVMATSLSRHAGQLRDAFVDSGIRSFSVAKGLRVDVSLPLRLAARLLRERVDVVHTHNPHALVYGAPAGRLARAAVIHTKHGMNPDLVRRLWLRRAVAALADAYVAVTPALAEVALRNRECPPERLSVVPNGIDVKRFAPSSSTRRRIRAELGIPEKAWVVGTVGRLASEKNQAFLVRVMAPLLGEGTRLLIVGDGSEREALENAIAHSGRAEFVHMAGSRSDVEHVLSALDVFALTSNTEGLPLVLLEAMATELPVVSTNVGGIPDVIEQGSTGFLVGVREIEQFRAEISALRIDRRSARSIGKAARRQVLARYSIERMAADYASLYVSVRRAGATSSPALQPVATR